MDHTQHLTQLHAALVFRRHQLGGELSDHDLRILTAAGSLVRVLRGCYIDAAMWGELYEADRLLVRTLAIAELRAAHPPVFAYHSAAALWGLPLYGLARSTQQRVHVLTPPDRPGRNRGAVIHHVEPYAESDVTTIAGRRVTTLGRTLRDLARCATPELALGCADRAARLMLGGPCRNNLSAAAEWRAEQLELLHERQGTRAARGVRQAHQVLALADPRADSVAESVSRLQLTRLGIPFEFQVPVAGLDGAVHRMDFEFTGQACFGEMDGRIKYTDPAYRNGRTLEQVLLDEKAREDEVRGVHRKSVLRWGWENISSARALGDRLRAFGLRVPAL